MRQSSEKHLGNGHGALADKERKRISMKDPQSGKDAEVRYRYDYQLRVAQLIVSILALVVAIVSFVQSALSGAFQFWTAGILAATVLCVILWAIGFVHVGRGTTPGDTKRRLDELLQTRVLMDAQAELTGGYTSVHRNTYAMLLRRACTIVRPDGTVSFDEELWKNWQLEDSHERTPEKPTGLIGTPSSAPIKKHKRRRDKHPC